MLFTTFLCSLFSGAHATEAAPTHRALVIAVGDYKNGNGWADLSSANDAVLIQAALESRDFAPENIHTLADGDATANGILSALDTLAEQTHAGDRVVIHYSGHGYSVADDNGDEQDGVDEVLVGHDAESAGWADEGMLDGYIRDDVVGEKLAAVQRSAGADGHVLLLLDSCFSGTASRGASGDSRGKALPEGLRTGEDANATGLEIQAPAAGLASLVILSAARYDQKAQEVNKDHPTGPLTHAFTRALADHSGPMSYAALLYQMRYKIDEWVGPKQQPQMEGAASLDVLEGTQNAHRIGIEIKKATGSRLVIAQGRGEVSKGDQVEVYPTVQMKPTPPLAKGKVVEVGPDFAVVELDEPAELNRGKAWAFVTVRRLPLHMTFGTGVSKELRGKIEDEFRVQSEDPRFTLNQQGNGFCLQASPTAPCSTYPAHALMERLKARAMADQIRYYDAAPESAALEFDFVKPENAVVEEGVLKVCNGTSLALQVGNQSGRDVHFSITAVDSYVDVTGEFDDLIYAVSPKPDQSFEVLPGGRTIDRSRYHREEENDGPLSMAGKPGDQTLFRLIAHSTEKGASNPPLFGESKKATQEYKPGATEKTAKRGNAKEPTIAQLVEQYTDRLPRFTGTRTLIVEVKACPKSDQ
jgi:hypothetical protein